MASIEDYLYTFIGARYVPKFSDSAWNSSNVYEPLIMVVVNDNIYISKQYVPAGIQISNTEYWEMMGIFNETSLQQIATTVSNWLDDHPEASTTVEDGSITDAKLIQSGGILGNVFANSLKTQDISEQIKNKIFNGWYNASTDSITPNNNRCTIYHYTPTNFVRIDQTTKSTGFQMSVFDITNYPEFGTSGWQSNITLKPNHTYCIGFRKYINGSEVPIKISDIINQYSIHYGAAYPTITNDSANSNLIGETINLATIKNTGFYYFAWYSYDDNTFTDLPNYEYSDRKSILLKCEYYRTQTNDFAEQTLFILDDKPTVYKRLVNYLDEGYGEGWKQVSPIDIIPTVKNKKLSIYGDSISTYVGYIPEGNATYYTGSNAGVTNVNQTWWMKTINALNLELLVNNSWSGRAVSSIRDNISGHETDAGYKENNVLQLKDGATLPDIIIVKLGINDFNSGCELGNYDGSTALPNNPTKFTDAYAIMLDLIMRNYPLAKVYCCTLMQCERSGSIGFPEINSRGDSISKWNEAIIKLANAFGAEIMDHNNCGLTYYNLQTYMGDYNTSGAGLHPNASGHSLIANKSIHTIDNAVRTRY